MPYYDYETIPQSPEETPIRFEVKQCMDDAPLTTHPETGVPVKRVYTPFSVGTSTTSNSAQSGCDCCCGGHCHH